MWALPALLGDFQLPACNFLIAIVNAATKQKSTSSIVAAVYGEWIIKRLYRRCQVIKLRSENLD